MSTFLKQTVLTSLETKVKKANIESNSRIHMLSSTGVYSTAVVGPAVHQDGSLTEGSVLQYMVPRGTWFASELGKYHQYMKYFGLTHTKNSYNIFFKF